MSAAPGRPVGPVSQELSALADWLREHATDVGARGELDVAVTGVALNTAQVLPGDLYAALPGARAHGADFVAAALEAGAVAVLTDPDGLGRITAEVPVLVVGEPRRLLGELSARLYDHPATAMRMIGVTGTQGKTTTTMLAEAGLRAAGVPAAVVGTIGTRIDGVEIPTSLTTPEAPELQALFAVMRERRIGVCAMEVSSHALVLGRTDGFVFDVAVFTNLGRDHLDFHADIEDYFAAKAELFTPARSRVGLVNIDDEHGRRLVEQATVPVRTFSLHGAADWRAEDIAAAADGSRFTIAGPGGLRLRTRVPMPGDFNVANALAAVAACAEAGLDPAPIAAGLATGPGVPGRLERVAAGQSFPVIVDYAHKPDALAATLGTLRPLTAGRLIVVLGAGGDRDRGKRPVMGEVAARLADLVIVTDDNPRTEDPAEIRRAVLAGAAGPGKVREQADRRLAIRAAVAEAEPGDLVLIAGKGHETGQEIDAVVHDFDDRLVARQELARLESARQESDRQESARQESALREDR